jgi:hypothetical protein
MNKRLEEIERSNTLPLDQQMQTLGDLLFIGQDYMDEQQKQVYESKRGP